MCVKYFVVLICIPLLVRLNVFTCLMTINLSTVNFLLISFTHFSIWLFANIIYIYYLEEPTYTLDTNLLPIIWITYIFSPTATCFSFYGIHCFTESFYFNIVKFINIFLHEKCFWCLKSSFKKKSLPYHEATEVFFFNICFSHLRG